MANTTSGGGGGGGDDDSLSLFGWGVSDGGGGGGGSFSWSSLALPSWLSGLKEVSDTLVKFGKHPKRFVRGIFLGWILSGIAAIVAPIFRAIQLMLLGSNPMQFAAANEQYGLLDLPALIAGLFGDTLGSVIETSFEAFSAVLAAVIPQLPGPIEGIIATLVFVMAAVVAVRIGLPLLRAGLEAIPVIGGPLSTLLGKL